VSSQTDYNEHASATKSSDWIDKQGNTYDGVSATSHPQFDLNQFKEAITSITETQGWILS
jgi:hypothetical protein